VSTFLVYVQRVIASDGWTWWHNSGIGTTELTSSNPIEDTRVRPETPTGDGFKVYQASNNPVSIGNHFPNAEALIAGADSVSPISNTSNATRVNVGPGVNIRSGAGAHIAIYDQTSGNNTQFTYLYTVIGGDVNGNNLWYKIRFGDNQIGFVSDAVTSVNLNGRMILHYGGTGR